MDVDQLIKPLLLKDLRVLLRNRGCNPGGGIEDLRSRLKENMVATGNYSISLEDGSAPAPVHAGSSTADMHHGSLQNNYQRPGGMQNVGNFLTDKPSSRVLAAPGGASQIMFGDYADPYTHKAAPAVMQKTSQGPPSEAPYAASYGMPSAQQAPAAAKQAGNAPFAVDPSLAFGTSRDDATSGSLVNNYARPGGQQNVGNYITNRPSSRVLAPPGGKTQIFFG